MKIILSPAKKMVMNNDDFSFRNYPVFLSKTEKLLKELKSLSYEELKDVWKCSDKLVKENEDRLKNINLKEELSPAIFTYVGLAFQHLAPSIMSEDALEYIEKHLRILSGFYGVLKPFDGIREYRLEMQQTLPKSGDLYTFWKDDLYKEVKDDVIINLASKEYSKCIESYLKEDDKYITISFNEEKGDKLIQKGTMAKMARGEMVYWMAEHNIIDIEDIKKFNIGYKYSAKHSSDKEYVFIKEG